MLDNTSTTQFQYKFMTSNTIVIILKIICYFKKLTALGV